MMTFSTYFKNIIANYKQNMMNAYLTQFIALAICQKECSVLDKAIKAYF